VLGPRRQATALAPRPSKLLNSTGKFPGVARGNPAPDNRRRFMPDRSSCRLFRSSVLGLGSVLLALAAREKWAPICYVPLRYIRPLLSPPPVRCSYASRHTPTIAVHFSAGPLRIHAGGAETTSAIRLVPVRNRCGNVAGSCRIGDFKSAILTAHRPDAASVIHSHSPSGSSLF
jgi:hypothetical protein